MGGRSWRLSLASGVWHPSLRTLQGDSEERVFPYSSQCPEFRILQESFFGVDSPDLTLNSLFCAAITQKRKILKTRNAGFQEGQDSVASAWAVLTHLP